MKKPDPLTELPLERADRERRDLRAIVEAVANADPHEVFGAFQCVHCHKPKDAGHAPSCPWLAARAWVEARKTVEPEPPSPAALVLALDPRIRSIDTDGMNPETIRVRIDAPEPERAAILDRVRAVLEEHAPGFVVWRIVDDSRDVLRGTP
jgi:hypothetical protein